MAYAGFALLVLVLPGAAVAQKFPPGSCGERDARFDALCSNPQPASTCVVQGHVVLPPSWTSCEWSANASLEIMQGATIGCANRTARSAYKKQYADVTTCEIVFKFDEGISIGTLVSIRAGTVVLESSNGHIAISEGAMISTTGSGLCGGIDLAHIDPFTHPFGFGDGGAGHGGDGGTCTGSEHPPGMNNFGQVYGMAAAAGLTHPERPEPSWRYQGHVPYYADLYGVGTSLGWSQASFDKRRCCGGGVILLNASRGVQLDGTLTADAQEPCSICSGGIPPPGGPTACCDLAMVTAEQPCHGLGGASGGTIAVHGGNVMDPLNGTGTISATGGDGHTYLFAASNKTSPTAGGSGGRLQLSRCNPPFFPTARTNGGVTSETDTACGPGSKCQCGSAGTIFYESCDGGSNALFVDNAGQVTAASSYVSSGTLQSWQPHIRIDELHVLMGAQLKAPNGQDVVSHDRMELKQNARIVLGPAQSLVTSSLSMKAAEVVGPSSQRSYGHDAGGATGDNAALHVGSLTLDPLSKIAGVTQIHIDNTASIEGHIEVLAGVITMTVGKSLNIEPLGAISANGLVVNATSVQVNGHIETTRSVQGYCPRYELDCSNNTWVADCAYPLLLNIEELTVLEGVIAAGAMRICANRVLIKAGQITSSNLGHPGGVGPSTLPSKIVPYGCVSPPSPSSPVHDTGAGSGAAHGGSGGVSGGFVNTTSCNGGMPYDDPYAPGDMGSGGGGEEGGQGGGVLHLSALESLQLQGSGSISSDGDNAGPNSDPDHMGGSGGGSGGAIWLEIGAISMSDSSSIHAKGGNGMAPGGGGGGGGLIHLQPPRGVKAWATPLDYSLQWRVLAQGGAPGEAGSQPLQLAGDPGVTVPLTTIECADGMAGSLCLPCDVGTFKSGVGEGNCSSCAPGYHQQYTGQSQCDPCAAGMVAYGGALNCSWCDLGKRAQGATKCVDCEPKKPRFAQYVSKGTEYCEWKCANPRHPSLDGSAQCVLLMELLLPPKYGGPLILFSPAVIAACVLLALMFCTVPVAPKKKASGKRPGSFFRGAWERILHRIPHRSARTNDEVAPTTPVNAPSAAASPLLRPAFLRANSAFTARGSQSPTLGPPSIESLQHAMMWEQHKYRAKQHVLRVHLTGRNTAMHPWRLPPLTPELRLLVAESAYYRIAEQFCRAAEWRLWEPIVLALLWMLPPFAVEFLHFRRKLHFARARRLMRQLSMGASDSGGGAAGGGGLWRGLASSRVWEAHRIELGCSHEYNTGWLDIFLNVSTPMLSAPTRDEYGAMAHGATTLHVSAIALQPGRQPSPSASRCNDFSLSGGSDPSNVSLKDLAVGSGVPERLHLGVSERAMPRSPRPPSNSPQHSTSHGPIGGAITPLQGIGPGTMAEVGQSAQAGPPHPVGGPSMTPSPSAPLLQLPEHLSHLATALGGVVGGTGGEESPTSAYNPHRLSYRLVEPRVTHEVRVCGLGTYLSPYWIELADFLVYDAFSSSLDASPATVCGCLNVRLRAVCHYRRRWKTELHRVLALLEYVNSQQQLVTVSTGGRSQTAPTLALVHAAPNVSSDIGRLTAAEESTDNAHKPHGTLMLLFGSGEPSTWTLPKGAQLLTSDSLDTFSPAGIRPFPLLLDVPASMLFGYFAPMATPMAAAAVLLSLLVTEMFVLAFVLSGLCQVPVEWPERAGACVAVVLCPPLAGVAAPLAGVTILLLSMRAHMRPSKRRGTRETLAASATGKLVRDLHLGAVWNVVSLPNALVAQACFVPLALDEARDSPTWHVVMLMLLPACLILTKLLSAQAYAALAASATVTEPVWAMLKRCEEEAENPTTQAAPPRSRGME